MSVRSPENIAAARESVKREPRKSLRRRSLELKLLKSSLLRILKIDNGLKNYRIQIHQRLFKANTVARIDTAQNFTFSL